MFQYFSCSIVNITSMTGAFYKKLTFARKCIIHFILISTISLFACLQSANKQTNKTDKWIDKLNGDSVNINADSFVGTNGTNFMGVSFEQSYDKALGFAKHSVASKANNFSVCLATVLVLD